MNIFNIHKKRAGYTIIFFFFVVLSQILHNLIELLHILIDLVVVSMSLVVQQQGVVGKHLVVQLVHNLLHLIHKHWYYILDHKFHWQLFVGNESLGILEHKKEVEVEEVGVHHNLPHQSHMDHYYIPKILY